MTETENKSISPEYTDLWSKLYPDNPGLTWTTENVTGDFCLFLLFVCFLILQVSPDGESERIMAGALRQNDCKRLFVSLFGNANHKRPV
jgi:hypothetical protein